MSRLFRLTLAVLATYLVNLPAYATTVVDNTPWPSEPVLTPRTQPTVPVEKRPLFIFAFVHDDIPESKIPSIFPEHFLPMIKEIKLATGRDVSVRFIRNTPPYTTYAYKGDNQASYDGWKDLGAQYRDLHNLPRSKTTKFMLLTNDWMNDKTLGLAGVGQPFAIATLSSKQVVGHEVGHMLDAKHELSEVRYNGWWCETFMAPKVQSLLSNCYVFTNPNHELIKQYLGNVP